MWPRVSVKEWGKAPASESEKKWDGPARVKAFAGIRGGLEVTLGFGFNQGPKKEEIGRGLK